LRKDIGGKSLFIWLVFVFIISSAFFLPKFGFSVKDTSLDILDSVKEGMTRSEVVKLLGKPNIVEHESISLLLPDKNFAKDMQEVLVYYFPKKKMSARVKLQTNETVQQIVYTTRVQEVK